MNSTRMESDDGVPTIDGYFAEKDVRNDSLLFPFSFEEIRQRGSSPWFYLLFSPSSLPVSSLRSSPETLRTTVNEHRVEKLSEHLCTSRLGYHPTQPISNFTNNVLWNFTRFSAKSARLWLSREDRISIVKSEPKSKRSVFLSG